jgi:hypothetical protein
LEEYSLQASGQVQYPKTIDSFLCVHFAQPLGEVRVLDPEIYSGINGIRNRLRLWNVLVFFETLPSRIRGTCLKA